MTNFDRCSRPLTWCAVALFAGALTACGGGQDPILGTGAAVMSPAAGAPTTPVTQPLAGPGNPAGPVAGVAQPLSVLSTRPDRGAAAVCPSASINATFTIPSGLKLDPITVNQTSFTVTTQAPGLVAVVPATVTVDPSGRIATFKPQADLTAGVTYTASIKGGSVGVKDLAAPANTMASDYTWNFTAGPATGACLQPVALKTAAHYGVFGGTAGMTNDGISTVITGSNGATASIGTTATGTSSVTGFHDSAPSDIYTETGSNIGFVTDKILTCTVSTTGPTSAAYNPVACTAAKTALGDAQAAYDALAALQPGPNPDQGAGSLANLVLTPSVYKAASGSFNLAGGDLTLDGQGDANAVFVFQMASTLTVGGPGVAFPQSITLINGAQAKNVFWQVGSAATINAAGGGTMVGTIIAHDGVTISTAGNVAIATLNGRALSLVASVTMVNAAINVPAP